MNEREPAKAKIAELLELRFRELNITSSRIPVDPHTATVVTERLPRLLILDYLLGDFTTGLDILTATSTVPAEKRPRTIFFTDEPSINVAVQALKGGAEDYIEIDSPHAIHIITEHVERIIGESKRSPTLHATTSPRLDELVAGTPAMQHTIRLLRNAVTRRAEGIVLFGPVGSGCTTLARGALAELENPGGWSYLDLTTFHGAPTEIPGIIRDPRGGIRPHPGHTVVLDHVEYDDGEIVAALAEGYAREPHHAGMIIACTSDETAARGFSRATRGETISIPDLSERKSDIGALVQRFIRESESLTGKKIAPFETEIVLDLTAKGWPGNVRQLRSVVMNAALEGTSTDRPIATSVAEQYAISSEELLAVSATLPLDPLVVAATFEMSGRHYRRTAARLGCSTTAVRAALAQHGALPGGTP